MPRRALDTNLLVDLGRLAPPERQQDLRRLAEAKGLLQAALDDTSCRSFRTDPATLADGGVADFLQALTEPLARLGARFASIAPADSDGGQTVIVDSVPEIILTAEEHDASRELATVRAFTIVNRRLAAAGSPERLYALPGDGGLRAVLLTPRLVDAIWDEVDDPEQRPYLPSEDDAEGEAARSS